MDLNFKFRNKFQEEFFNLKTRNNCFSGGFNNGKSFVGCLRAFVLLSTFPNYKYVIARQYYRDLKATTMETFFKICPTEFVASHSDQEGITILKNGSQINWMHLDSCDEQSLRGLEINSALIDQAEEIEESIYLVLDSRIGRWDKAIVPEHLLDTNRDWIKTPLGNYKVPTYMDILCNPDSQFHWIYRYYHPDSVEKRRNHSMVASATDPNLGDPETINQMLSRDPEWVKRYYKGEWGISDAQIHTLPKVSILDYDEAFVKEIIRKGNLYRSFDHGESAPSCCLWWSVYEKWFICYREYYVPNRTISYHRSAISDLSVGENYIASVADPAIFKKQSKSNGGLWSIADEYVDPDLNSEPIFWTPADNNEFATRNRINELLQPDQFVKHPVTGLIEAPRLYFIKRSDKYPNGCFQAIKQIQSQRRKQMGSSNGKIIFSDDREDRQQDHAYDAIRYFIAMHGVRKPERAKEVPRNSFNWYNRKRTRKRMFAA